MEDMAPAWWLTYPLALHSGREFECGDFTPEQCDYYRQKWHFWYEADLVFALPTIAFFMCTIGVFIIGYVVNQLLSYSGRPALPVWSKTLAGLRYLSYRGFHVKALRWNSAPVGVLTLGAVGVVYIFCMDLAPKPYYWPDASWGNSPPLATRSGWLALACMPFVLYVRPILSAVGEHSADKPSATASKTNWITLVTGVTHEKIQVFHRWTSYAFFILALLHTFPFIVVHIRYHDMVEQVTESATIFYWTGIVALICQAWLTFASMSPLRSLNYEFFKASHLVAVILFVITLFWHCDYTLTSWDYFIAAAAVYVPCFVFPWLRTCFEYGLGQKAHVFVEDNDFIRVTIPVNFEWTPGQHCFLRFCGIGLSVLTSHPFTICSLPSRTPGVPSEAVFYMRRRGGLTARLFSRAQKQPGVSIAVMMDGPYGGINMPRFHESDRLLVVAGGSGAGWSLAFIEQFARYGAFQAKPAVREVTDSSSEGDSMSEKAAIREPSVPQTASPGQSLRVVLATRDTATRVWFRRTIADLFLKYPALLSGSNVNVEVHLTGDAEEHSGSPKILADLEQSRSSSSSDQISSQNSQADHKGASVVKVASEELHGRPQLPDLIREEAVRAMEGKQSLGCFVCGPETMQNDARNAAAKANLEILGASGSSSVYLHLEHFSWA